MTDVTRAEIHVEDVDETDRPLDVRVDEVDAEVRAKCAGQPVEDIAVQAAGAFETIGVFLTTDQLDGYVEAVSRGNDFTFDLE